jgi:hypothetical protein
VLTPRRVGLLFIPLIFEEIMVGHGVTTICLTGGPRNQAARTPGRSCWPSDAAPTPPQVTLDASFHLKSLPPG